MIKLLNEIKEKLVKISNKLCVKGLKKEDQKEIYWELFNYVLNDVIVSGLFGKTIFELLETEENNIIKYHNKAGFGKLLKKDHREGIETLVNVAIKYIEESIEREEVYQAEKVVISEELEKITVANEQFTLAELPVQKEEELKMEITESFETVNHIEINSRAQLSKLSEKVRLFADMSGLSINEALKVVYGLEADQKLYTFSQVKKNGWKVLKGSKSYRLWSKPIKSKKNEEESSEEEKKSYSFYGIAKLFTEDQIDKGTTEVIEKVFEGLEKEEIKEEGLRILAELSNQTEDKSYNHVKAFRVYKSKLRADKVKSRNEEIRQEKNIEITESTRLISMNTANGTSYERTMKPEEIGRIEGTKEIFNVRFFKGKNGQVILIFDEVKSLTDLRNKSESSYREYIDTKDCSELKKASLRVKYLEDKIELMKAEDNTKELESYNRDLISAKKDLIMWQTLEVKVPEIEKLTKKDMCDYLNKERSKKGYWKYEPAKYKKAELIRAVARLLVETKCVKGLEKGAAKVAVPVKGGVSTRYNKRNTMEVRA